MTPWLQLASLLLAWAIYLGWEVFFRIRKYMRENQFFGPGMSQ